MSDKEILLIDEWTLKNKNYTVRGVQVAFSRRFLI